MKKFFLLLFLGLSGCATLASEPCVGAREAMIRRGYKVLECWHDQMEDTYERVERCLVVLPGQDRAVPKTVFVRHCGL